MNEQFLTIPDPPVRWAQSLVEAARAELRAANRELRRFWPKTEVRQRPEARSIEIRLSIPEESIRYAAPGVIPRILDSSLGELKMKAMDFLMRRGFSAELEKALLK
jgi:hypothetical protein